MQNKHIGILIAVIGIMITIYLTVFYQPDWVKALLNNSTSEPKTAMFKGNVGNLSATFNLKFDYSKNKINGIYFYPSLPNVTYKLTGDLFMEGNKNHIKLTEYSNDIISATCELYSRDNDKVCYSGTMYNTDGQVFKMDFCKVNE
jgi:hypothetical protein